VWTSRGIRHEFEIREHEVVVDEVEHDVDASTDGHTRNAVRSNVRDEVHVGRVEERDAKYDVGRCDTRDERLRDDAVADNDALATYFNPFQLYGEALRTAGRGGMDSP
jgi:hypothetical protein